MPIAGTENRSGGGLTLLDRAFQVLELFDEERPSLSQAEMIRLTGLPKSTVSRLVRHLCSRGYLVSMEAKTGYCLGPSLMELGRRALANFDLREVAAPWLDRLSQVTGETIMLTAVDPSLSQVICVDQVPGRHGGLQVFERIGASFPLNAGAVAKAVLAFLPDSQRRRVLAGSFPRLTPATVTDPELLMREVAAVREIGYALSREETYVGVYGVAAPIFGLGARVVGSIAVAGPMYRMQDDVLRRFGRLLCAEVAQLSLKLGAPRECIATLLASSGEHAPAPNGVQHNPGQNHPGHQPAQAVGHSAVGHSVGQSVGQPVVGQGPGMVPTHGTVSPQVPVKPGGDPHNRAPERSGMNGMQGSAQGTPQLGDNVSVYPDGKNWAAHR